MLKARRNALKAAFKLLALFNSDTEVKDFSSLSAQGWWQHWLSFDNRHVKILFWIFAAVLFWTVSKCCKNDNFFSDFPFFHCFQMCSQKWQFSVLIRIFISFWLFCFLWIVSKCVCKCDSFWFWFLYCVSSGFRNCVANEPVQLICGKSFDLSGSCLYALDGPEFIVNSESERPQCKTGFLYIFSLP